MTTLNTDTLQRPTPEEMQVLIRKAHAERAQAMREFLAALWSWRGKGADRTALAPGAQAAPCA